jgi:hypothetical protein
MDIHEKWDLEGKKNLVTNIDYSYYKEKLHKKNDSILPFLNNRIIMGFVIFTSVLYLTIAYLIIVYK